MPSIYDPLAMFQYPTTKYITNQQDPRRLTTIMMSFKAFSNMPKEYNK